MPYYRGDHGPEIDNEASGTKPLYIPNQRLVHLDLKGAPPKIEFLISFLKKIKDVGATGKNTIYISSHYYGKNTRCSIHIKIFFHSVYLCTTGWAKNSTPIFLEEIQYAFFLFSAGTWAQYRVF